MAATLDQMAYSFAQAAKATGIPRTTLYAERKLGNLKARRLGKRAIILAEDLRAFLEGLPAIDPKASPKSVPAEEAEAAA